MTYIQLIALLSRIIEKVVVITSLSQNTHRETLHANSVGILKKTVSEREV